MTKWSHMQLYPAPHEAAGFWLPPERRGGVRSGLLYLYLTKWYQKYSPSLESRFGISFLLFSSRFLIHDHAPISMRDAILGRLQVCLQLSRCAGVTLAPRAVVDNFVRKNVAVDAEVVAAHLTSVPATLADALDLVACVLLGKLPCLASGFRWFGERRQAGITSDRLVGLAPRDFDPVTKGEQMMVGSCKMSRENQGQAARGTLCWQAAHLGRTSCTEVSVSARLVVACTQADRIFPVARGPGGSVRVILGASAGFYSLSRSTVVFGFRP